MNPFIIFQPKKHYRILRRFDFIGKNLSRLFPFIRDDLEVLDPDLMPNVYLTSVFISSFIIALLPSLTLYILTNGSEELWLVEIASFLYLFLFFLIIGVIYPRAKVKDMAKKMDRDLSFVLNDIIIQLRSGVLLYDALVIAANSNYGLVSKMLKEAIKNINQGYSESESLVELARKIKSSFMRKTLWQLANSMHVGGDISSVLESIETTIREYNERDLRNYLDKVNLLLFGYLLLGAVLPAIFLVAGVIISSVLSIEFSTYLVALVLSSALVVQMFLLGYIKTSKPAVIE